MILNPNTPWKVHARQWSSVGQPLRPGLDDIHFVQTAVSDWLENSRQHSPTVLVMGVTPELCSLPLDSDSRFIALDKSFSMIENLWRPRPDTQDTAICGDWRSMPLSRLSVDLALGDGSLSNLRYPDEYETAFRELRRVLRPTGRCLLRCFMQLDERETIQNVIADLNAGLIGSFHALKWRLVMALQPSLEEGVAVDAVWQLVNERWPDLNRLAQALGCPLEQVSTIRAYQNVPTRYTFPTFSQYCDFFAASRFSVVEIATHRYELGERCPTFVLEKQADDGSVG